MKGYDLAFVSTTRFSLMNLLDLSSYQRSVLCSCSDLDWAHAISYAADSYSAHCDIRLFLNDVLRYLIVHKCS